MLLLKGRCGSLGQVLDNFRFGQLRFGDGTVDPSMVESCFSFGTGQ